MWINSFLICSIDDNPSISLFIYQLKLKAIWAADFFQCGSFMLLSLIYTFLAFFLSDKLIYLHVANGKKFYFSVAIFAAIMR